MVRILKGLGQMRHRFFLVILVVFRMCGVDVRIFPSTILYFCSNVLGSLTFVAILTVFRAT